MNNLREIKVTYSGGIVTHVNMAAHLTDGQMLDYFRPGKVFNIGSVADDLRYVIAREIIK
jgi:hypothetical protein